ncbi:MAG: SURF1 family protein [Actinomycetota bacterium]|nr:SURF1 family protein [Actinomycetota bacterium]
MTVATTAARRFWLRPKWVVGHVLVVVLVVAFVNLGFWQLRRLDEKRAVNAAIEARSSLPLRPVEDVVDPAAGFGDVDDLVYRRVSARGTYDPAASVLVRSRSLDGRPGFHVLTPLVTGQATALVVNRGFAPFTAEPAEALAATRPPSGEVEVTGLLFSTQEREGIGPTDPAEGVLREISRVDLARLQAQYGADVYPLYLQLSAQVPAPAGALPIVLPEPEQSEGNHLSYAVQWFVFAAIGAGGWPLLLRNTARERRWPSAAPPPVSVGSTSSPVAQPTNNGASVGP